MPMPDQPEMPYEVFVLCGTALDRRFRQLIAIVEDQLEFDEQLDVLTPEMEELSHITRMLTRLEKDPCRDAVQIPRPCADDLFIAHSGGYTFFHVVRQNIVFLIGALFRGFHPSGPEHSAVNRLSITGLADAILRNVPAEVRKSDRSEDENEMRAAMEALHRRLSVPGIFAIALPTVPQISILDGQHRSVAVHRLLFWLTARQPWEFVALPGYGNGKTKVSMLDRGLAIRDGNALTSKECAISHETLGTAILLRWGWAAEPRQEAPGDDAALAAPWHWPAVAGGGSSGPAARWHQPAVVVGGSTGLAAPWHGTIFDNGKTIAWRALRDDLAFGVGNIITRESSARYFSDVCADKVKPLRHTIRGLGSLGNLKTHVPGETGHPLVDA
jgi:hypothetical protein